MRVVVRVFPVTSTSLGVVFWGLFGFLYGALGSVCALSCVRFGRGFVNHGNVEWVSVSDVINFRLETVITPSWFLLRSSSLRRVFVDYFLVWLRVDRHFNSEHAGVYGLAGAEKSMATILYNYAGKKQGRMPKQLFLEGK
ncbi:MAG TPA: hypothetical protein VJ249_04250 [Candidatus Bathyarchaeia archaeon]|nr:hypothetical protein [Candidatus Bathyarchaeia archaeon]